MRVVSIECRFVRLPTRIRSRWRGFTEEAGSCVMVRLRTDDGIEGWGEATALAQWGGDHGRYYGETPGTVTSVIGELFAPILIGCDPAERHDVYGRMDHVIRGHPYAKTAVEEALLDIQATSLGVPVSELLGGRRRKQIPVAHSVGLSAPPEAVEEASEAVGEGARTIKLKVGEDAARDVETVLSVREALGDEVDLVIDANQGWRTPAEAIRMIRAMEPAALRYVEQPVAGIPEMAHVASAVSPPLMADESMWTAHDLFEIAKAGAASLASIYTAKGGGLARAMQADAVAFAAGFGTNVNGSGEAGVGNLANLHLASALESLTESSVLPVTGLAEQRSTNVIGAWYADDILAEPLRFGDGCVTVPEGPGWGIPVDEEKVERFTAQRWFFE